MTRLASTDAVLRLLRRHDGMTCAELGEALWADRRRHIRPGMYARPAGRILRRLEREGRAWAMWQGRRYVWRRA